MDGPMIKSTLQQYSRSVQSNVHRTVVFSLCCMLFLTIFCQYLVGDLDLEGQDLIDITASAILGFSGVDIQPDVQNNSKVAPSDFGEDIMEELRVLGFDRDDGADFMDHLPPSEIALRRDLRRELVITVDPSTSQDFDDALHVKACDDGLFEVGIHIADVSYFVFLTFCRQIFVH
jgi:hypothetical protein